jgi:NAD-dependent dihydropyrimidine dehydrogenase PreA subunit
MVREMVKIDEELCNGCGLCVPGCHEGALQIIDGKARLISDLMCDGLGACIGHCPQNAITIEKREAEAYNETKVMEIMVAKGKNTVVAHLKHLKDHNETGYLREGVKYMRDNEDKLKFSLNEVISEVHGHNGHSHEPVHHQAQVHDQAQGHASEHGHIGGCPGSRSMVIERPAAAAQPLQSVAPLMAEEAAAGTASIQSELRQWPVQLHLVNPQAPYYRNADILIAADCTAFALGDFHQRYLRGESLAIACPKLDSNMEVYVSKITSMIDHAQINTITVMIMQVPCCGGLLQIVKSAASAAQRRVPIKLMVVSIEGDIIREEWT